MLKDVKVVSGGDYALQKVVTPNTGIISQTLLKYNEDLK